MKIEIFRQHPAMRLPTQGRLKKIVQDILVFLGKPLNGSLSLAFVDDAEMTKLNKIWKKRHGPTDVLSFPGQGDFLGETIINYQEAKRRSLQEGESPKTIMEHLVVHGVLSLLGKDHHGQDARRMYKLERKVLKSLLCPVTSPLGRLNKSLTKGEAALRLTNFKKKVET